MSCESSVTAEMNRLGFNASTKLAFFIIRDRAGCNEDCRAAIAKRWLSNELERSDKMAVNALNVLRAAGWIKTETRSRGYTMVTIMRHRQEDPGKAPEKDPRKDPANIALNQYVFESMDPEKAPEKDPRKDPTGVSGCYGVSLGVRKAVTLSGLKAVEHQEGSAAKSAADRPLEPSLKKRSGSPLKNPEGKYPGYSQMVHHMTDTWAKKKGGVKYKFLVGDGNQLAAELRARLSPGALAALWDTYLASGDEMARKNGYSIREFCRQVGTLIDDPTYKRRGEEYQAAWFPDSGPSLDVVNQIIKPLTTGPRVAGFYVPAQPARVAALAGPGVHGKP